MYGTKNIQTVEKKMARAEALPDFRAGDTVVVHAKIKEGAKERIQYVEGVVIRRSGKGANKTFTLRKISGGIGVEIIYPEVSPAVTKVEIKQRGKVRQGRIYYVRKLTGKAARLKSGETMGTDGAAEPASAAN
ncbi:MAG: 50S ribosomal protein L19 [Bdellovibrionales bacterium]|nr:50S ribosomal protein L19 [Bdellovibrionales bacterium]